MCLLTLIQENSFNASSTGLPVTSQTTNIARPSQNASDAQTDPSIAPSRSSTTASRRPPGNWAPAEHEKLRLYNEARSRAVAVQSATGVRLDIIGLDDSAPPEYAPPLPAQPAEDYKAPSRPVSMYTVSPNMSLPGSPEAGPPASPPGPSMSAAYSSATNGKEEPHRRFEEAQSRMISPAPDGQSTPTSPVAGPSELPQSAGTIGLGLPGFTSAAEEKEQQRRRFEDAQNRVVSAGRGTVPSSPTAGSSPISSDNGAPNDDPVPYDSIFPPASSSPGAGPSKAVPIAQIDGGLSEKEQMRRYYEAQDRVAQAKLQPAPAIDVPPSSSTIVSAPTTISRSASAAATNDATPSSSSISPSALDQKKLPPMNEKEQMRRYYEAMERVRRASGSTSGSAVNTEVIATAPSIETPPKPGPSASAPSRSNGYLSAADEKALMQKRFDEAQAAVQRNSTASSQPTTASSLGHQRTASSMSNVVSSPPDSPLMRDPTVRAGKAKAIQPMSPRLSIGERFGEAGPPPPLPTKPPMDYINLLSPVEEMGNPWLKSLGANVSEQDSGETKNG